VKEPADGVTRGAPTAADGATGGPTRSEAPPAGVAGNLRALLRLAVLLPITLAALLGWAAVAPFRRDRPALRRRVTRAWANGLCRVIGLRPAVDGAAPAGPGILVTNHVSYLDVPVLLALTGGRFVAKREVSRWPLIGWLARTAGTLFVARGQSGRDAGMVLEGMERALREGDLVVFFPEGTTTRGDRVLPFKSGLLALAARREVAVLTGALAYRPDDPRVDGGRVLCWADEQSFVPHLWRLLTLRGVRARIVFSPQPVSGPDRKLLALALERRVAALHAGLGAQSASPRGGSPSRPANPAENALSAR
jgi:1-acyl-sn-glycerol-3-phosphate acyltransferase